MHLGKKYNCNICKYSATQKGNLLRHIKSTHFQGKLFFCQLCDYKAAEKSNLSIHLQNVHQKREKIICTDCNKSIKKSSLYLHRKSFHSGEQQTLYCNICTFQTKYKQSLKGHILNVHQKRKQIE